MDEGPYSIEHGEHFASYLAKVPVEIRRIFAKRLDGKYRTYPNFEHKKGGVPFHSDWIGGKYRVCFMQTGSVRRMEFIGNHKDYDRFLAQWERQMRKQ